MRIIFFGTSEFGCPTLEILFKRYEIPFVITAKIKGKEEKVSPIKDVVKVDDFVHGCPMQEDVFLAVLGKYLKLFKVK